VWQFDVIGVTSAVHAIGNSDTVGLDQSPILLARLADFASGSTDTINVDRTSRTISSARGDWHDEALLATLNELNELLVNILEV
jgi:hypothetical protein